jgi:hypothetical protein
MTDPTPLPDTTPPAPDPGNSGPDAWSTDLDDDERERAYTAVNDVAVTLPEPALDDAPSADAA